MKLYGVFVIYDPNSNINSSDYRSTILITSFTIEITTSFIKEDINAHHLRKHVSPATHFKR
jgi:hypothetical protein